MRRCAALILSCWAAQGALAQYPLTRTFELRAGLQRPRITLLAQDDQGLLWAAGDQGLLRSDGEHTELMWAAGDDRVSALHAAGGLLFAATEAGYLLRCAGQGCDTLGRDTVLLRAPARALWAAPDGMLWLGTYGAGITLRGAQGEVHVTTAQGLGDDHVNALCPVGGGRVAVATDQGISICGPDGRVLARIGEEQGAPDNLVLSLAPAEDGGFWAGTHRSGVFHFDPDRADRGIHVLDPAWAHGAVRALAASGGSVWAGGMNGVVVVDVRQGLGAYVLPAAADVPRARVSGLLRAADGAVWWCDGSERVARADPDVLVVPDHEGLDLRHITALCADTAGHLWFATAQGVFRHDVVFADRSHLFRVDVPVDPERPVVALQVDAEGHLWAGTFGQGVYRVAPDGRVRHFGEAEGLCNGNVLAVRTRRGAAGPETWFATLGGVCVFRSDAKAAAGGAFRTVPIPGSGFVYDVLPLADGSTLVATDGNGLIRIDVQGRSVQLDGPGAASTYYSLCADGAGGAWACGPGTGICRVHGGAVSCAFKDRAPFDGDVFGIAYHEGHLLALGRTGLASLDPAGMRLLDLGEELGLQGVEAELNTVCTARSALWLACDRGLVRLTPRPAVLDGSVAAHFTGLYWGDQSLPLDSALALRHDQNFLTFRFAAPHYAAPGQVHFAYRLIGFDPTVRTTRDREVTWSRLPPGDYRFEVKALLGNGTASLADDDGRWARFPFTIAAPWWRRPWAIGGAVLALSALFFLFIRNREERMRYRDRVEQERTRFQLEALRSQVNPHFLFNSFNTLIDLIEQDRDKAVAHVEHLSDFFREILGVRDRTSIPLSEELQLVRTYFYLEQRRFGDRVALQVDVPDDQAGLHVPPLAVQLLVENALKHNAATAEAPLVVEVRAGAGELEVANVLRPRTDAPRSTGFGIAHIRRHYAALTDRPVTVSAEAGRFVVRIPLLPAP